MKQIKSIKIVHEYDDDPDLSWLGKFSNEWSQGAIDRKRFGDWDPSEMRYFIPCNHWPHNPKNWAHVSAEDLKNVIAKHRTLKKADWTYALEDMRRLESFGDRWVTIGIYAKARIVIGNVLQTIRSGGLWGIESDSDESYIESIEVEELADLITILAELGFAQEEMDEVEVVEWE